MEGETEREMWCITADFLTMGISVVSMSDAAKSLLSCRVPNLNQKEDIRQEYQNILLLHPPSLLTPIITYTCLSSCGQINQLLTN